MATLLEEDRFVSADYKALTVAELVEFAQDQDQLAAGELYERYHKMVLSVAYRRMGNFSEGERARAGSIRAGFTKANATAKARVFWQLAPPDNCSHGN